MTIDMPTVEEAPEEKSFEDIMLESEQEYEQTNKELQEIGLLLQQSSSEVEKLAQRNAQISSKMQMIEGTIDSLPRQDIVEIYKAAQDSQTRLFTMRGQVEQLQNKKQFLERHAERLHLILDAYRDSPDGGVRRAGGTGSTNQDVTNDQIMNIINAQENERLQLSKELHDGPAQSLTNLILQAEICERLFDKDPSRTREELGRLKDAVNNTFRKIREYIFELRPMILDDLGLIPTLKQHIQDFEGKHNINSEFNVLGPEQRLPPHIEVTLFRVIQSLLKNVSEHANATQTEVSLDIQSSRVSTTVTDNGSGFDVNQAFNTAREQKRMGIVSIKEQLAMLNGEIAFDSNIGDGTTVSVWLPLD